MNHKLLKYLLVCIIVLSCTEEGEFSMFSNDIENDIGTLLKTGTFTATSGITVSGNVEIREQNNKYFVRLVNFNVSSGPDLKIYLSKSDTPAEFVNLGALENNKSVYQIPDGVLLNEYSYVLIHCQQYNHLFAIAKFL